LDGGGIGAGHEACLSKAGAKEKQIEVVKEVKFFGMAGAASLAVAFF
jgi:hypothetical protein